jgi:uncharacterized protein YgiB involved in biofilm formation
MNPNYAVIAASSSGDNAIVAAVTGKRIRVLAYALIANAAVNAKWRSASTDVTGLLYLAANGGVAAGFEGMGCFQTAAGEALNLNLSGAVAVGGHLTYVLIDG